MYVRILIFYANALERNTHLYVTKYSILEFIRLRYAKE